MDDHQTLASVLSRKQDTCFRLDPGCGSLTTVTGAFEGREQAAFCGQTNSERTLPVARTKNTYYLLSYFPRSSRPDINVMTDGALEMNYDIHLSIYQNQNSNKKNQISKLSIYQNYLSIYLCMQSTWLADTINT